jgi:NTE family protein
MNKKTAYVKFLITLLFVISLAYPALPLNEEEFLTDYLWSRVLKLSPPERPRIALVLGGGGARGLTHIGVLKVLEEEKIPVDIIAGTSVGALVGALYSAGIPLDKIESMADSVGWSDLVDVSGPALAKLLIANSLLSSDKMEQYLQDNIGKVRFDELKIKFACVATDLVTGERIIFREGDVAPAARASATIPGVFQPVEYRHRFLVDGGLLDNIPTDVAELMGADFIIAVTASGDFTKNEISNVFMVLTQSINIQGKILDESRLKKADVVIKPHVGDISVLDLGRSKECINSGVLAAKKAVDEIKKTIIRSTSDYYLFK